MTISPTLSARIADLEADVRSFLDLAAGAEEHNQFSAAVSARTKAAAKALELADLRATMEGERIKDPVRRLKHDLLRAEAAGSWVAVTQLQRSIDEAAIRQAKDREERAEAKRRAKKPEDIADAIGDALVRLPAKLRRRALARLNLDGPIAN